VSDIPLELLTEADKRWMLTAEYGGTGGKKITSGMIVEEPDIEIGAGPSSKGLISQDPTVTKKPVRLTFFFHLQLFIVVVEVQLEEEEEEEEEEIKAVAEAISQVVGVEAGSNRTTAKAGFDRIVLSLLPFLSRTRLDHLRPCRRLGRLYRDFH
jgi:hypothetical protein